MEDKKQAISISPYGVKHGKKCLLIAKELLGKKGESMKDRKHEIVRENIPLIYWNNIVTSHFAKITPDLDTALNKCEEEFEEMLEELNINGGHFEDVRDISKEAIKEMLDTFQAYGTLIAYIASERGDFNEILSVWKRKQKQRIRQYLGDGYESME